MLKAVLKFLVKFIVFFLAFAGVYLLAAWLLPYITVNNSFRNAKKGIKVFVLSNGVHTDFVVPAVSAYKNWQTNFPQQDFNLNDATYAYIGFGWGDKGFYLNTPTWADLTFATAFKATFGLSETAMHVTYLKEPKLSEKCVALMLDEPTYLALVNYIESGFEKSNTAIIKIDHSGYGPHDLFYEAVGTYSLFKTCNNWSNKGLKHIGVKNALWSPFAKGLMRSLKTN